MKIRILSPAQDEIHSIIRYYDDQAVGLGLDFIEELDEAWDLIREHPEIGARYHGEIRCTISDSARTSSPINVANRSPERSPKGSQMLQYLGIYQQLPRICAG